MKKGFTLIELLVVLVIIGVLIGLILPNALTAIKQANTKECSSNLRSIDTAIHLCYAETKDWTQCSTIAQLTAGNYLNSTPKCAFSVTYTIVAGIGGSNVSDKAAHFATWPPQGVVHK